MKNTSDFLRPGWLACAILLLGLCACQGRAQASTADTATLTHVVFPSVETVQATETPSAAFTPSPFPSQTPTFTPIPQPAEKPSSTPTAAATEMRASFRCAESHGKIETQNISTGDVSDVPIPQVTVYLPPCYQAHPERRYPVLYLLHGLNNDNQQWVRIGAPLNADSLISSGKVPPFLIIMPKQNLTDLDSEDASFGNALVNDLVPWVDQHYATCTDRVCRAIGGLSLGSGWAMRIGLVNWQVFGAIGANSYSPFQGDLDQIPNWVALSPADQHPRIYIDIGSYDQAVPDAMTAADELTQLRVPHEWHLFVGAHNEDYWSAHVNDYLRWYAEAWN